MTIRVTFLSMTHHVHTYVLCENRSSIHSLTLMHSVIKMCLNHNYALISQHHCIQVVLAGTWPDEEIVLYWSGG